MKTEKEPRFINIKGIGEKLGLEEIEILELARAGILVVDNLECPKKISDVSIKKYLEKNLFPNPRRNDRWEDGIKSLIRFMGETEKLDCIIYGLYLSGKSIFDIRNILKIRRSRVEDGLWRAQVRILKADDHTKNLIKIKDLSSRLEVCSVLGDKVLSYCDEETDKYEDFKKVEDELRRVKKKYDRLIEVYPGIKKKVIKNTVLDTLRKLELSGIQDLLGKYPNPRDLGDIVEPEDLREIQEYLHYKYEYVWIDREESGVSPKYIAPVFKQSWAEGIYTCPIKLWPEILEVSRSVRKLGITDYDSIEIAFEQEKTKPRSLREFHSIYPERKDYNPFFGCHRVLEYVMVELGIWNRE